MNKAFNQYGKLVDIIESIKEDTYTCPVCKEILTRNFGAIKQFYSHPFGKGDGCELKFNYMIKDNNNFYNENEIDILRKEYYEKTFDDVKIELSDYMSDEGYYLTQEQKDIIFAEEDRIKIAALAGASKSHTLYYYAKNRPFKKILYVVYNKSMRMEADLMYKNLPFVTVKTQHALAFGHIGRFYKDKLTLNYGIVDIIKDLNLNWNKDMELAAKIDCMMKEYMLSDVIEFDDMQLFLDNNGNTNNEREEIIRQCKRLWELKKTYKNRIGVEHDFYLKLYHLAQVDLSNKYDIIMVDECQDLSKLLLDILKFSNVPGIVMVGDKFQSLYSWRKSTNIMPLFDGKEYKLTTSFRVSQNIAHIANIIISDFIGENIQMKGFNIKQTIVDEIDKTKPYVCLCRTNAYIFSEVADALDRDRSKKLYFEGGFQSYKFLNLKDCYFYSQGHTTKNKLFSKFKDFNTMQAYAEEIKDIELLSMIRMVDKYGSRIVTIVDSIKNNTVSSKDKADIIFSTIHRAKGATFSLPVYISNDHLDIESVYKNKYINPDEKSKEEKDISEEIFIIYVSITRGSRKVELSEGIKKYLMLRYKHLKEKIINN